MEGAEIRIQVVHVFTVCHCFPLAVTSWAFYSLGHNAFDFQQ